MSDISNGFTLDDTSMKFVLSKAKNDLAFLERGRDRILEIIEHSDNSEEFNIDKLDKLNKSIERYRDIIRQFETDHSKHSND